MKIGILTFFYGANYGAQAHSYALYHTLENQGHTCEFISYYPKSLTAINLANAYMASGHRNAFAHPLRSARMISGLKLFKEFHSGYRFSPRVQSGQDIDALGYDMVILGSDEVFNVNHQLFSEVNYGAGIRHTSVMTYAPSSGQTDGNTVLSAPVRESLRRMTAVSGRDRHTVQLLQNNGARDVRLVLDPTLLYDYVDVAQPLPDGSYVLLYAFRELDEYQARIREYARKNGLAIVSIARRRRWADKNYELVPVRQWLGAFSGASLVVTDSFHGTLFSIKAGREFLNTGFAHNVNKVTDLLDDLHIARRFYDGTDSIEQHMEAQSLDYTVINTLLEEKKAASLAYLLAPLA